MHIEYLYIVMVVLSAAAMWACFRLIERHGNTPRANSYMTLSQIAAGEGSGFFRFLVLRIFPPLVVLTGEASILAKWEKLNQSTTRLLKHIRSVVCFSNICPFTDSRIHFRRKIS